MPTTVSQAFEISSTLGVDAKSSSAELAYFVRGTNDQDTARAAVVAAAPTSYTITPYTLPLIRVSVQAEGYELFRASAQYGVASSGGGSSTGDDSPQFNFEIGGGTDHITQSKATVANYALSGTAPVFNGAIGVTDDGVEGVDIVAPQFEFSETQYKTNADVDTSYKVALYGLVGKTNNASFKGFGTGEVLFLGATGARRGTASSDKWEITYRFAVKSGVTGATIGGITGIDVPAWHVRWVRYTEQEDATAKTVVKRPTSVHVERVYDSGNFADLEL